MPRPITVLKAVSDASLEIGITQNPLSVAVGAPDSDVKQMVALLAAVAEEVLTNDPYKYVLGDGMWIWNPDTSATDDKVTTDNELILFDGRLAINGLKWRFLSAKGLEYGEQLRDFTTLLGKKAYAANARVLDLNTDVGVQQ